MYLIENFQELSFKNMTRMFSINARPYRFPSRVLSSTLHKKHNELLVALRLPTQNLPNRKYLPKNLSDVV